VVDRLLSPFERAGRLLCPVASDFERAALALSRLRERGQTPRGSKSALLDALIATIGAREGALVVTHNVSDFRALATEITVRVETFDAFRERLLQ